ncbi:integrase [Acinetobacter sp. ANC 4805]|uniref:integrase n=1 Tax=Acinetobacter sp. ANC 4805 TaxID=2923425 RepID=UPI001F4BBA78|nr:integrase [Acinetobacter sp. ANC 4805]MCH7310550.1 integrase [Acinetobacter sp. ANC 4805]
MNFFAEAQIELPANSYAPEAFNLENTCLPSSNFVVSRLKDGTVISTYGDLVWDFSVYHPDKKLDPLIFKYWEHGEVTYQREQLVGEMKHVFFLIIWMRNKAPLSNGTLRNYLTVMKALAQYAENESLTIKAIIGNQDLLLSFIRNNSSGWLIETLSSLLRLLVLVDTGESRLNISVVGKEVFKLLYRNNQQYRNTLKQHPPIPTRIYSKIISNLLEYLDNWEKVADEHLDLVLECYHFRLMRKNTSNIKAKASKALVAFVEHQTKKFTLKQLSAALTDVQRISKLIIQVFTGMRDEEAQTLPFNCVEKIVSNAQAHYVIRGRTTKFNRGKVHRTKWVTNYDGARAVQIAQKVATAIYLTQGITIKDDILDLSNNHPLYISSSYLGFTTKPIVSKHNQFSTAYLLLNGSRKFKGIVPNIEEEDLYELEQLDPHRAWRAEEKFQIGFQWSLTTHQLRRSLALYAHRSGLVSLPSLRRQLQHITNEMTSYYAKGSSFAKDFINDDKKHFGLEWQDGQFESSSLSYIFNVLLSKDVLYGGHAHWVEHRLKDKDGVLLVDRKETINRFKKGELAYKETIVGGCTKVGSCNQIALNWLQINCLTENCRHLVVNLPKLERVIKAQQKMISFLDITSLEYRTEISHLEILNTTKNKILNMQGEES